MLTVVGLGRVGGALVARARAAGVPVTAVGRGDDLSSAGRAASSGGPILVTTRNDDLDAVLTRVDVDRQSSMVFVQNGVLRGWLRERGLVGATRGLLFLAVPTRGAALQPGGESPFYGLHAEAVVGWLTAVGVPARVVSGPAFFALEAEKLLWNTVYGLLSEATGRTVGEVCDEHAADVHTLVAELLPIFEAAATEDPSLDGAPRIDPGLVAVGMDAYSRSIPDWRGALKEWRWRNGWFVAEARRRAIPTPLHDEWLRRTGYGSMPSDA